MSAIASVDRITKILNKYDQKLDLDTLIIKASSKAFYEVFNPQTVDVSKINDGHV